LSGSPRGELHRGLKFLQFFELCISHGFGAVPPLVAPKQQEYDQD